MTIRKRTILRRVRKPCTRLVPGRAPVRVLSATLALAALQAALASCGEPASGEPGAHTAHAASMAPAAPSSGQDDQLHVAPPPFSEGVFPCSDCHDPDVPVRRERRELRFEHTDIVLRHDEEHRWCLDCHDAQDRDQLHLANGTLVPFEESYRLCGQCHGDKYRDWRAGVHGRRTGEWNGEKSYLLCVHCHNSHDPAFRPLRPLPPPVKPRRTP
jgi:hypothetical protein